MILRKSQYLVNVNSRNGVRTMKNSTTMTLCIWILPWLLAVGNFNTCICAHMISSGSHCLYHSDRKDILSSNFSISSPLDQTKCCMNYFEAFTAKLSASFVFESFPRSTSMILIAAIDNNGSKSSVSVSGTANTQFKGSTSTAVDKCALLL